jgi:MFS family permease
MSTYEKNSLRGIIAWFTASIFYAFHNSIIAALTLNPQELMSSLSISTTQFGLISVFYTIGYAAMQIPVGVLIDHFSLKKLMITATLTFTLGCFIMSIADSYLLILAIRLTMGAAAAFAVLAAFKISAEWFDSRYFATLAGLTVSLGYLGSIIGNKFIYLYEYYTLTTIFFYLSLLGLLITVLSSLFIKNYTEAASIKPRLDHIFRDLKAISCNRGSVVLILYAMLIFTPLLVFKDSLGPSFFQSYYQYSAEDATFIMDIMLFSSIITAPVLGLISDKIGKRKPIITYTPYLLLMCFLAIFARVDLLLPTYSFFITCSLFAIFGSIVWGFLLSYSVFKETHDQHIVSTGLGLMQTVNMLGGIIATPMITSLIDHLSSPAYGLTNSDVYFYAFMIIPVFIVLALPLLKHIPETNCKQIYD